MYIHKFGGASINSSKRIENVVNIVRDEIKTSSLIVVSALGKTTNSLERLVEAYKNNEPAKAFSLLDEIKNGHYAICDELFTAPFLDQVKTDLNDIFVEIEWMIEVPSEDPYNYIYDQIVSVGELASSKILQSAIFNAGINVEWIDARDLIKTDNKYRNASVDWEQTQLQIKKQCEAKLASKNILVTQGFIGCTSENFTTTLGREGSDFTAAIFASSLSANSMTVWKDVPGVMTADPAKNPEASLLPVLSYTEALAMTYFGAKVIHPKTIKPIQLKNIPLYVRSFIDPQGKGTEIKKLDTDLRYPPIVVIDENNIFLKMFSKDNTFIREQRLGVIFTLMDKHGLVLKLDRNTPESFIACIGDPYSRIKQFIAEANEIFSIEIEDHIQLLTIRHGDESSIINMLAGKKIIFKESSDLTIQYVLRNS